MLTKFISSAVENLGYKPYFSKLAYIRDDGVMEVGKYIDFHDTTNDTTDFSIRLLANNNQLKIYGAINGEINKIGLSLPTIYNSYNNSPHYLRICTGELTTKKNSSLQFIIADQANIARQKRNIFIVTCSTRETPQMFVYSLLGTPTSSSSNIQFSYYEDELISGKYYFCIYTEHYDDHIQITKLSKDYENIWFDFYQYDDIPSNNLTYVTPIQHITSEGGQTINGSLTTTGTITSSKISLSNNDIHYSGTDQFGMSLPNSYLILYGKENSYEPIRNSFLIAARGDDDTIHELKGLKNGSLTWCSNSLSAIAVVARSITSSGYISLACGLIIQWGSVSLAQNDTTKTIQYSISFPLNAKVYITANSTNANILSVTNTNTDATVYRANHTGSMTTYWFAIGY